MPDKEMATNLGGSMASNENGTESLDFNHPQNSTPNGFSSTTLDNLADDVEAMLAEAKVDDTTERVRELAELLTGDPATKIMWTAGELLSATFADVAWAVPGLIPAGLSILAGRPKLGKSWLALQVAVACATGGKVLEQDVQLKKVLYLALEDGPQRLKERLNKLGCPAGASLTTLNLWPLLIESGLEHLTALAEHEGYELIVIDTLARFGRIKKPDQEAIVTERLDALQRWAIRRNVAVVLIDHHRKAGASMADLIDDVMGASSKTGMADAVIGLYRSRGQQSAELKVTGRDLPEREMAINFDPLTFSWQLEGEASDVRKNTVQKEILDVLREDFEGLATCTDLARALGRHKANVRRELLELVAKGKLKKLAKRNGKEVPYELVGKEPKQGRAYKEEEEEED